MKTKILVSVLLISIVVSASAQAPVLTAANVGPEPGDVYLKYNADTTGVVNGAAGANQTWNYSNLVMTGTQTSYNYINPASAPNAASFPMATVVFSTGGLYSYQLLTATDYAILGIGTSTYAMVYSDPETLCTFPFTYLGVIIDSVKGSYTSGSFTFTRTGVRLTSADGWGALVLPSGTYMNMLRMKVIQDYTDVKSVGGTTHVHNEVYEWYDGVHKSAALEIINTQNTTGSGTLNSRFVLVSSDYVGISEPENVQKNITFEPGNPVNDHITFKIKDEGAAFVQICDLSGRIVAGNKMVDNNGRIDLTALPAGLYILKASTANENVVRKFIKL